MPAVFAASIVAYTVPSEWVSAAVVIAASFDAIAAANVVYGASAAVVAAVVAVAVATASAAVTSA